MIRNSRTWRLLAIFLTAILALAACGSDDDSASDTTDGGKGEPTGKKYALAFVGPLTGDAANLGINIRNGIKVAIEEARKDGLNIELKEFDTQGDPAQATTQQSKIIDDTEIIGVVGPTFSGETKALLPALTQANLVMVSASATAVDIPDVAKGSPSFHRIIPDDDVQGQGVADYITKGLKAKKVFYIHDNSDYGKGLAEGTEKLVTPNGATKAGIEAVDPKSQDFSAAVNKAKAANPDVIFYGGYYAEAGRLRKQLVDANVDAKFLSGDGALDPGFVTSGGAGAEGAQITCPCNLATTDAEGELGEFAKAYKSLNNADPGTYSTEGYDSAKLLIAGIEDGNDTREKLLEYVEELDSYDGLSKTIEFEENGNVKAGDVFFFEVKGGKIVLLGTTEDLVKE
jgi:branched-chain amino acid transport system substrate-binding protein